MDPVKFVYVCDDEDYHSIINASRISHIDCGPDNAEDDQFIEVFFFDRIPLRLNYDNVELKNDAFKDLIDDLC